MTQPPRSLSALLTWYREEVNAAIPQRIHQRAIDDGGAPEWHGAFRAWMTAHPATEDKEGNLISPLRYWLWRMGDDGRGAFLATLIRHDFDWRLAAEKRGVFDHDAAHDYCRECLRRLNRAMYGPDGQPTVPVRPKLGDCAAQGCPHRTSRLYCAEHAEAMVCA